MSIISDQCQTYLFFKKALILILWIENVTLMPQTNFVKKNEIIVKI